MVVHLGVVEQRRASLAPSGLFEALPAAANADRVASPDSIRCDAHSVCPDSAAHTLHRLFSSSGTAASQGSSAAAPRSTGECREGCTSWYSSELGSALKPDCAASTHTAQGVLRVQANVSTAAESFTIPATPDLIPDGPWKKVGGGVCAAKGFTATGGWSLHVIGGSSQRCLQRASLNTLGGADTPPP